VVGRLWEHVGAVGAITAQQQEEALPACLEWVARNDGHEFKTGTSPACDTRFGSSNSALILASACNNRTYQVSSRTGNWKLRQLPFSQLRGHHSRLHVRKHPFLTGWIEA
jgi:hypothetical protein